MDTERLQARIEQLEREVTQLKAQVKELNEFCFATDEEEEFEPTYSTEEQELYRESSVAQVPPMVVVEPPVAEPELEPAAPVVPEPIAPVAPESIAPTEQEPVVAIESKPFVIPEPESVVAVEPEVIATEPEQIVTTEPEPIVAVESEPAESEPVTPVIAAEPETIEEPEPNEEPELDRPSYRWDTEEEKPQVSWETRIGKKILPIAASLLIFVAIVLFSRLIQPHLTDGIKAALMAIGSIGLSAFGIVKMKKESRLYTLYSAIAGCGIGACYISSLVSHFVLGVLPETGLMACMGVWIVAVIALSRYKSKMFAYICYIGILVAVGLVYMRWNESMIGLWVYIGSIAALFAANATRQYRQVMWYFIQFPIVLTVLSLAYNPYNLTAIHCIYGATLVVLLGQLYFYLPTVTNRYQFLPATLFSMITLWACVFGVRQQDESIIIGYHLLFTATCLGLCAYFYRIFRHNEGHAIFWLTVVITAFWLPIAYYGDGYHYYCGNFLLPALLALGVGLALKEKAIRWIGYLYMVGFIAKMPYAMKFSFTLEGDGFQYTNVCNYGYFIVLAILIALASLRQLRQSKVDCIALLLGFGYAILQPYAWNVYDFPCLFLLVSALFFYLNYRLYHARKLIVRQLGQLEALTVLGTSLCVLAGMFGLYGRVGSVWSVTFPGLALLQIPAQWAQILMGAVSYLFVFGQGLYYRHRFYLNSGYVLLVATALLPTTYLAPGILISFFVVGLLAMFFNQYRHYTLKDRMAVTTLAFVALVLPMRFGWIHGFETWSLCSLLCIVLHFLPFARNPITGQTEETAVSVRMGVTLFVAVVGNMFHAADLLYIGHALAGTEVLRSCLLLTLLLSLTFGLGLYLRQKEYIWGGYLQLFIIISAPAEVIPLGIYYAFYWIGLLLVFLNLRLRYTLFDKFVALALVFLALLAPLRFGWLHWFETWTLLAILSLVLHLIPFDRDPQTGETEKSSMSVRYLLNVFVLFTGMMLLRQPAQPLFIVGLISNTEVVNTVTIILLMLALSGLNVKRIYGEINASENHLSLYNGVKFTLLLYFIFERLAVVGYVVSIAGILLSLLLIVFGFRKQLKGLRLYGLVVSMICVIKLIFFDIVFDNEFYRPVSFLVAGLLLFLISYVYFKLEKNSQENDKPKSDS